jgi:hypothetical protein
MTRLSRARHGKTRQGISLGLGLGIHAISCYKSY